MSRWLGPSDDIPDVDFAAFLRLMQNHFLDLVYTREAHYYARFRLRNQNPLDPQPLVYPIFAREQGTVVGYEQIKGLLEYFGFTAQQFRDAYNTFYGLKLVPSASEPKL